jgi:hypothetical protein
MIDGQSYPYSPSLAGAKNARALLDDAMAVIRNATAPRQWVPIDLEAVTKRTIDKMNEEGWLVEGEIEAGRFRKRLMLRVDWSRTPWTDAGSDGSAPLGDPAAHAEKNLPDAPNDGGGQLVNSWSID